MYIYFIHGGSHEESVYSRAIVLNIRGTSFWDSPIANLLPYVYRRRLSCKLEAGTTYELYFLIMYPSNLLSSTLYILKCSDRR